MTKRPHKRATTTQATDLLVHLLRGAQLRVSQDLDARLEPHGLVRSELSVLSMLVDQPKARLTWLAKELSQSPSNLSLTVSGLEEQKLVTRARDSREDRRIVYVSLTARGHRLIARTSQAVTDHCEEMRTALGKTDHDKLVDLLARVAEVLGRASGGEQV